MRFCLISKVNPRLLVRPNSNQSPIVPILYSFLQTAEKSSLSVELVGANVGSQGKVLSNVAGS